LITRDGLVEVANDHGQLDHVAQHWGGHIHWTVQGLYPNHDAATTPPGSARRTESNPPLIEPIVADVTNGSAAVCYGSRRSPLGSSGSVRLDLEVISAAHFR
jgi:hypothetical protein